MGRHQVKGRFQNKKDTEANWAANDLVLLDGEIVSAISSQGQPRLKVGDGARRFSQLPYVDGQSTPASDAMDGLRMNLLLRLVFSTMTAAEKYRYSLACPVWAPGVEYLQGMTLLYSADDTLYETREDLLSSQAQPPGSPGAESLYTKIPKPAEPSEILPWVLGEQVEQGDLRSHGGLVYERILAWSPGANICEPHLVPTVWKLVER